MFDLWSMLSFVSVNKPLFNFQLTAKDGVVDKLEAENKALQDTVAEKEVRAADILQQAKSKIMSLLKVAKKHQSEAKGFKDRLTTVESALKGKSMFFFKATRLLERMN